MIRKSSLPILWVVASVLCLSWAFIATGEDKPKTLDTDPHLVGWWKFDETAGKTAADSSKFKRKGTLKGELSFDKSSADGKIGKALRFGGKDDVVEIKGYKGVTGTKPRTVTAWIKTNKTDGEIISWGENDFGRMFYCRHIRRRIGVTPDGGYLYMKEYTNDDKWRHIGVVVIEAPDDSPGPNLHDHVKLYLDGELAIIDDIGLLDLWPLTTGKEIDVRIGRRYIGLLDDLRLYDRALSEDEVKAIYELKSNQPLPKAK
ncbi:MAG: LamG domain-containing protein [Planctomycetes bacterium]|nr:LamG domain-containing protein [Planctomycetota bacterium]MBL7152100.1 LamG domain-containing protein [Phycisphaerae bacterium]